MSDEQTPDLEASEIAFPSEPAPVQPEPDESETPETIDVLNEASREPETVTFSVGAGDTVRIHIADTDVVIVTKENFEKVIDWYGNAL